MITRSVCYEELHDDIRFNLNTKPTEPMTIHIGILEVEITPTEPDNDDCWFIIESIKSLKPGITILETTNFIDTDSMVVQHYHQMQDIATRIDDVPTLLKVGFDKSNIAEYLLGNGIESFTDHLQVEDDYDEDYFDPETEF